MCALEVRKRAHTPLPKNLCKRCNGDVIKKVSALFRGAFTYGTPECVNCGRIYIYAENVRPVGEEAFQKLLNQPTTI